ncbi:hypothetical protein AB5I41_02375 [Sphingomonas sp. MMS24-JH45]
MYLVCGIMLTSLVGYALTGWGPSYMQRSLGMSMLQVANYIALPAALVAAASALIGGAIADRMAKRHGLYAQPWVIATMKTIAFPSRSPSALQFDPRRAHRLFHLHAVRGGLYRADLRADPASRAAQVARDVGGVGAAVHEPRGAGPGAAGGGAAERCAGADLWRGLAALRHVRGGDADPVPIWCYWRAGVLMKREAKLSQK